MLDQINWLIDYYNCNPNNDPNVVEFVDRLIGCAEELKNTKSEQAKLELKRAISKLGEVIVTRCSRNNIITDNALTLDDVQNYSVLFKSDFEYDHACGKVSTDFHNGKRQDPMFGVISSLVGRINRDENISKEELDYARKLMGIYFFIKQEERNKGDKSELLFSNIVEYFDLTHLRDLFGTNSEKYESMFNTVTEVVNPLAKAEELIRIYENDKHVDPNLFELLAVLFTMKRKGASEKNMDLIKMAKYYELVRLHEKELVGMDASLENVINGTFEAVENNPQALTDGQQYAIAKAAGVGLYLLQERKNGRNSFSNEEEYNLLSGTIPQMIIARSAADPSFTILAEGLNSVVADACETYRQTMNRMLGEEPQQK